MRDEQIGRILRLVRIRKDWTQADVAREAGVSRTMVGRHELGLVEDGRVKSIRLHASALGLRAEIVITGRGGDLARLTDDEHAAIVEHIAAILRQHGWIVEPEASYNHFGERGRIDLLAFHPESGRLLIVEVKTEFTDLQAMLGSVSVKERLAATLADERGWNVTSVSTMLAAASTPSSREVVRSHPTLFDSFTVMGERAVVDSSGSELPRRVLTWVRAGASGRKAWRAGRRRVRHDGSKRRDTRRERRA